MPSKLITKVQDVCSISQKEVEQLWIDAKDTVKRDYPKIEVDSSPFFALITAIFKNLVGVDCKIKMGWNTKSETLQKLFLKWE